MLYHTKDGQLQGTIGYQNVPMSQILPFRTWAHMDLNSNYMVTKSYA